MSDQQVARERWEPFDYLLYGFLAVFVAAIVFGVGINQDVEAATIVGYVGASLGGVVFTIGVIAKGVQVGNESTRATE